MDKDIIYIVSGNYSEFYEYVRKKNKRDKYKLVTNVNVLRGISNIKGFYIGTYYNRIDIEEIKECISIIKSKV